MNPTFLSRREMLRSAAAGWSAGMYCHSLAVCDAEPTKRIARLRDRPVKTRNISSFSS